MSALTYSTQSSDRPPVSARGERFAQPEVRPKVIGLLILLAMFALSVNGLNVVNSYIGRDLMTAIVAHDMAGFIRLMIVYVAVFAVMTAAAVLYRFSEERLGLLWRSWLTKRVTRTLSRST